MPLYTIVLPAGMLDAAARAAVADEVTSLHCDMAEVPRNWVHIVFNEYAKGCAFTAGEPAVTVGLTVIIRTGRSADYKRRMLERLCAVLKTRTGASDDQVVVGILEVPANHALEMGNVMSET